MVLMEDFPKIETILAPSGGFWGGVGEPSICVAAPAVLKRHLCGDRQADVRASALGREVREGMTSPEARS